MGQQFRAGVVIVIRHPDRQEVMAFERADFHGQWQFPQGGLKDGEEPVVHRSSGPWGHRDRSAALDGSYPKTHEAADRIMTRALVSVAVGLRAADHQECRDADG